MIISTPNWNQEFPDLVPQANGDVTTQVAEWFSRRP